MAWLGAATAIIILIALFLVIRDFRYKTHWRKGERDREDR
jgi:integral membrane sensor domain MASE1